MKMHYKKRDFARHLRKDQTAVEQIVWDLLKNRKCLGLKFRRQHVLAGFIVDFYCDECKLAIELDGDVHDRQKDYDELRDREISAKDIYIIRIRNVEINNNPQIIVKKINDFLSLSHKMYFTPSPSGRGGQGLSIGGGEGCG
jgi:very-short-patch-repair endonuclease